jgi:hypothetical protein
MLLRFSGTSIIRNLKFPFVLLLLTFLITNAFVQQRKPGADTCQFQSNESGNDKAQRIMYNQQSRNREAMRYQIIAAEACEPLARRMEEVRSTYITYVAALVKTKAVST